jgi:uncharacterized protein
MHPNRPLLNLFLLAFCLLPCTGAAQTKTNIPELHEYVTDLTGTLSSGDVSSLSTWLRRFEDSTSNQIVVVILPTIGQDALEEVSMKIVEANKVGQAKKDNGALLLVVKNDRLIRIEVGYGLEGALTDALCAQIIRHEITPRFRDGDYVGGIAAGAGSIMKATRNEYAAEPGASSKKRETSFPWIVFIIILVIVVSRMRRRSRFFGGGIPPFGGGWGGGGGTGGGFGGGFGGGGFGGGGGSFGGGGASGSW